MREKVKLLKILKFVDPIAESTDTHSLLIISKYIQDITNKKR